MTSNETKRDERSDARLILALMALALIPSLAGLYRLWLLGRGSTPTPDDARIAAQPIAMALHVVGATLYNVLGALLFAPKLRRARPALHRALGWTLAPLGIMGALAGLWLTLALEQRAERGVAVVVVLRLLAGSAMALSLALGVRAAVQRDLRAHGAWMTRAYALGSAAGTQTVVFALLAALTGSTSGWITPLGLGLGWLLNILLAERWIRRRAGLFTLSVRSL